MLQEEIRAKYKKQHDELSEAFYAGTSGLTKEQFDTQHGKVFSNMDAELKMASDYVEPVPPRNLEAEIDALKAGISALEAKIK